MDGLGRVFNVVGTADGIEIDVSECSAVTFICVGDEAYTVQEATSAAGAGATDLDVVDHFYKTDVDGGGAWTKVTQAADAEVDPNGTGMAVFTVDTASLSDGFGFLLVNAAASGLVTAILHDLAVQRAPERLDAVAA
jgi:hypothetical protein